MSEQIKNSNGVEAMSIDRVADMAHELRSPLGGIESMISLLGQSRSPGDQDALIAGLRSAAAHLRTVANAMLKPDELPGSQSVSVADAIKFFSVAAGSRARAAGIAYRQDVAPACEGMVVADGTALRQMLENVVDNAIRHGGAGEIILRVQPITNTAGGAMVEFSVLDSGPGIDLATAPSLFDRGETRGSATAGSGIGLSIVSRLASQAGGTCGAGGRGDQKGACVWFTVPANIARKPTQESDGVPPAAIQTPILVVDDDPMSRLLLKTVLGHLGHPAETASSPAEALTLMQDRVFAAVFTDMTMPGMDGWSFIRTLRQGGADLPVVGVSGRVTPEEKKRTIDAGANWVIDKPVTIHDLRQALIAIGLRDPMVRQVSAA